MKKAIVIASTAGFIRGFLLNDILLLQQMGYEVHCAANGKNHSFDPCEFFPSIGVPFHSIDFSMRSPLSKDTFRAMKQFAVLNSIERFDVIHCHTPIVGAIVRMVGLPAYLLHKCKIIYTTHGLAFPDGCSVKDKLLYGTVEWLCGHLCNGVITINHEDYCKMKSLGCKHVYHINGVGVNTKRFHNVEIDRTAYRNEIGIANEDIMVLAVGELSERKNHKVIVEALAELADQRYVLVICGKAMVGEGTGPQLKRLAKEKNVRLVLLGFRQDIPQLTCCADVAVLPSLREGLGLAGVEALAAGLPVVGASVQGIKDYVIDGKTGFLCDPRNPGDFAGYLRTLENPAIREKMRPYCIEKAEEFCTEVSHKQMKEIYSQILRDMVKE